MSTQTYKGPGTTNGYNKRTQITTLCTALATHGRPIVQQKNEPRLEVPNEAGFLMRHPLGSNFNRLLSSGIYRMYQIGTSLAPEPRNQHLNSPKNKWTLAPSQRSRTNAGSRGLYVIASQPTTINANSMQSSSGAWLRNRCRKDRRQ